MGLNNKITDEIDAENKGEVTEFVEIDPNSPFNPEMIEENNPLQKELEYLESNFVDQIKYLMEFSKFKILKRLILEIDIDDPIP